MHGIRALALATLMILGSSAQAGPAGLPKRVGDCVMTQVKTVETRLVDGDTPVPDSGSAVTFTNGGYQVSYDTVPPIERSRAGDPVRMCLIALPTHCPPGDHRGRLYKTTNQRTHQSWTLRDAEHMCGGA
jgi:hypothetical protein